MLDVKRVFNRVGPGGLRCPYHCCGPAPKHRKAFYRIVKKRERVFVLNDIKRSLEE